MERSDTVAPSLPLFVYGTLRDEAVRAVVLDLEPAALTAREASLPDHRSVCVPGRHYPRLQRSPGTAVRGMLLFGLDAAQWRRIAWFEGPEYRFRRTRVRCGHRIFAAWYCDHVGSGGGVPWCLERWRRRHRQAFLRDARRTMATFPG